MVPGSGRVGFRAGVVAAWARNVAASRRTPSGRARTTLSSAGPTSPSPETLSGPLSSTAITSPSASAWVNQTGGSRVPRPSR